MNTTHIYATSLRGLLQQRIVATMPEMKSTLGTNVDLTVFRKLKSLGYRTSYTHRGRYYALSATPQFDELGLWFHHDIGFSIHGTLRNTLQAFVAGAERGFFAGELAETLQVVAKSALLKLVRDGRLKREKIDGRFLYCAAESSLCQEQLAARRAWEYEHQAGSVPVDNRTEPEELKAAIVLFVSLLDEQQRRVFAGLESLKWGHGGDVRIAELLGLSPDTVAKGRRQLLEQDVDFGRVRKPGGGRKAVEKKRRR